MRTVPTRSLFLSKRTGPCEKKRSLSCLRLSLTENQKKSIKKNGRRNNCLVKEKCQLTITIWPSSHLQLILRSLCLQSLFWLHWPPCIHGLEDAHISFRYKKRNWVPRRPPMLNQRRTQSLFLDACACSIGASAPRSWQKSAGNMKNIPRQESIICVCVYYSHFVGT